MALFVVKVENLSDNSFVRWVLVFGDCRFAFSSGLLVLSSSGKVFIFFGSGFLFKDGLEWYVAITVRMGWCVLLLFF